jgi:hypothetical protein
VEKTLYAVCIAASIRRHKVRAFAFGRFALIISAAAALLSACGGLPFDSAQGRLAQGDMVPVAADDTAGATGATQHKTFSYTGVKQTFIVPAGVTRLTVIARGGEGGGGFAHGVGTPGFPGRVYAVIHVHSGEKLYVYVAGSSKDDGFNGGGVGGSGEGGYGGGASDVRVGGDALKDRIIVAAGGGTAGGCDLYCYPDGGDGGGLSGQSGHGGDSGGGGAGGTQTAGGLGGTGGTGKKSSEDGQPGGNGALGLGGNGGKGGQASGYYQSGFSGGGGGGGYYGGGGGGGAAASLPYSYPDTGSGGGGGGSSYVEPGAITSRMWTGWQADNADGQVIFTWK